MGIIAGQTGAGKTFTMQGPTAEGDGPAPLETDGSDDGSAGASPATPLTWPPLIPLLTPARRCASSFAPRIFHQRHFVHGHFEVLRQPYPAYFSETQVVNGLSGIIPRVLAYLFARLEEERAAAATSGGSFEVNCKCSYLEIYNEQACNSPHRDRRLNRLVIIIRYSYLRTENGHSNGNSRNLARSCKVFFRFRRRCFVDRKGETPGPSRCARCSICWPPAARST